MSTALTGGQNMQASVDTTKRRCICTAGSKRRCKLYLASWRWDAAETRRDLGGVQRVAPLGRNKHPHHLHSDNHGFRCRIPQRLPSGRQRNQVEKNKSSNYSEIVYARPKSASKSKDDNGQSMQFPVRSARTDRERLSSAQKKTATGIRKSVFNETLSGNKAMKQIITVPLACKQRQTGVTKAYVPTRNFSTLPDQETIKLCEDLETQKDETSESTQMYHSEGDLNEKESIESRKEKVMRLKMHWQETIVKFESMKNDLNERQRTILALYASLRSMHQKLNSLGHKSNLPQADDLKVMNVANMTPEQLLQLCSQSKRQENDNLLLANNPLNHFINRMNDMPIKLTNLCEETLKKRKEIIDWFDSLKNQEQGVSINSLKKKINEFNAENEMLNCTLVNIKSEFAKELNEIFDFLRKCVKETVNLQLRSEELTCLLSDVHSKNSDLRKQVYHADQCRSHNNKNRIMELEKQLKEEKLMKTTIRDRLSKAEGQVKMGEERAVQLEAALNQARAHTRNLERTVQQLNDQNHRLQLEFENELSKLNQSIKENTTHLEEIADAREKLQSEKEDLEKRLEELSNHYNESLDNIKEEQKRNVAKIIEVERKYNEEIEERVKRDTQIESLCTQLVEAELRYKDTAKVLQEQKSLLSKSENELRTLKIELDKKNVEIEKYIQEMSKQRLTIQEIENNLNAMLASDEKIKSELKNKENLIEELKFQKENLEGQVKNRNLKMSQYEEQLSSLKIRIAELQERWSDFENLQLLPEMMNEQTMKLDKMTHQNNVLAESLGQKNIELESYIKTVKEQEDILKERDAVIKILSNKKEEQENLIRLLKNNLEIRAQVDSEANQQLLEKNNEIQSLKNKLKAYKHQIDQLERIILKLEEEVQKSTQQNTIEKDKMQTLEKKTANFEVYQSSPYKTEIKNPAENLDALIKILEEELSTPIEQQALKSQNFHRNTKKRYSGQVHDLLLQEKFQSTDLKNHKTVPTKIEMGNFVKKTYMTTKNDLGQINNENFNEDVLNHNTQKTIQFQNSERPSTPQFFVTDNDIFPPFEELSSRDRDVTRNLNYILSNHLRNEKKRKIYKLASHRL